MMIDLSLPVRVEDCAMAKPPETGRLTPSGAGMACSARPSTVESRRRAPPINPRCIVESFCIWIPLPGWRWPSCSGRLRQNLAIRSHMAGS